MTKKLLCIFLSVLLLLPLAGCTNGGDKDKKQDNNVILDKIYDSQTINGEIPFNFIKFYDDKTFQALKVVDVGESDSLFGTYTIDENAVMINLSNESYAAAVVDNGSSIFFGKEEFRDITDTIEPSDPILDKFQ